MKGSSGVKREGITRAFLAIALEGVANDPAAVLGFEGGTSDPFVGRIAYPGRWGCVEDGSGRSTTFQAERRPVLPLCAIAAADATRRVISRGVLTEIVMVFLFGTQIKMGLRIHCI
jgi:hypothetical protein